MACGPPEGGAARVGRSARRPLGAPSSAWAGSGSGFSFQSPRRSLQVRLDDLVDVQRTPTDSLAAMLPGPDAVQLPALTDGRYQARPQRDFVLPDGVQAQRWYEPTERGLEARIRERLQELRRLNTDAASAPKPGENS